MTPTTRAHERVTPPGGRGHEATQSTILLAALTWPLLLLLAGLLLAAALLLLAGLLLTAALLLPTLARTRIILLLLSRLLCGIVRIRHFDLLAEAPELLTRDAPTKFQR
jgi:hypothetical protein